MADERIQEFNLDGKQLAFIVILGIAVAVAVFLCGVMVGRGVRPPQVATASLGAAGSVESGDSVDPLAELSASGGPRKLPDDDLRYMDHLAKNPPATPLREPVAEPVAPPPPPTPPEKAEKVDKVEKVVADTSLDEPPGPGFVVQVSSLTKRPEADTIARRLRDMGYRSFVSETMAGGLRYRVRVGKFKSREEAKAIAARLEKEGQFTGAWVDVAR